MHLHHMDEIDDASPVDENKFLRTQFLINLLQAFAHLRHTARSRKFRIFSITHNIKNIAEGNFLKPAVCLNGVGLSVLQQDQLYGICDGAVKPLFNVIFRNITKNGQLKSINRILDVRCNKYDFNLRQMRPDFSRKLHPALPRHLNVQQNQVKIKIIVHNIGKKAAAVRIGRNLASRSALPQAFPCNIRMSRNRM